MIHTTPKPHKPDWVTIEKIGKVWTQRCSVCGKTRTIVK